MSKSLMDHALNLKMLMVMDYHAKLKEDKSDDQRWEALPLLNQQL